jgi:hypothetical protein
MGIKIVIFWDVMSYSLVDGYLCFRVRRIQTEAAGSHRQCGDTCYKAVILNPVSFIKITCIGYQKKIMLQSQTVNSAQK